MMQLKRQVWVVPIVLVAVLVHIGWGEEPPCAIRFADATARSSIDFRYENGGTDKYYLVEIVGSGLCLFDADNDGLMDIYFANGAALPGRTISPPPSDLFYRNRGGWNYVDRTASAGLQESNYGLGVTAADYDNDGFVDLYISNFGPKVLMHNNGDGTFTDVTREAGVADGNKFGAGVTFLDANNDGLLDLFVGNYLDFDFKRHDELAPKSIPYPPGPRDFRPTADSFFLNQGDGTFVDASESSGIAKVAGPSMGVVAADFDKDGDVDIFVGCDGEPNLYYQNDGKAQFTEDALLIGVAYDQKGTANGSMGVDAADLDGNGLLDLVITNYMDQMIELFRNTPPGGFFDDICAVMKLGREAKPHVNWGIGLCDFDLDGDHDAYICNGHFLKHAKSIEPITDYALPNCVMENVNQKVFRSVCQSAGSALQHVASSRGAGMDDLDNDGDLDIVVVNCDTNSQVLENLYQGPNRWLQMKLIGTQANRDAVGAKVTLRLGKKEIYLEQLNGRGYQSHYGSVLHTGTGMAKTIDEVKIVWPGRSEPTVLRNVPTNQRLIVIQPTRD